VAEPEDVLAEGALHGTRLVREIWARRPVPLEEPPRLTDLRHRLELFMAAVFRGAPDIGVAEPPAPLTLLARLAHRRTSHLHSAHALPSADQERIRLPAALDVSPADIPGRYRLLALEQAARVDRGTLAAVPLDDPLLRDLYFLAEAAAVDAQLVRMFPRLAPDIRDARREAVERRPVIRRPSLRELAAEGLLRALLLAEPDSPPTPFAALTTPEESRAWALDQRRALAGLTGPYRGMAPVPLWGEALGDPEPPPTSAAAGTDEDSPPPGRVRALPRRPRPRDGGEDEEDAEPGMWMVRADDLQEKAEDPAGLQRPADRDQQADPGELADALSELPEARMVRRPGRVAEVLVGQEPMRRAPVVSSIPGAGGLAYPEWDWQASTYQPRAAVVRERTAGVGEAAWVETTLRRHSVMIRAVRRDFERLRPRRITFRRQPEGAELDIDALVAGWADRHADGVADERYYVDMRPGRRDAAIMLLVDASASTDSWVIADRRIIDVEKETLLVASEALAALGDPHAMLAFASTGPSRVTVQTLKRFDEAAGTGDVRRRIAGLEPDGYTRAGAAIRHATVGLMHQRARHRLLLLISDGRPNDIDRYEGRYGVEDTRAAVAEARLQGVHVHCLTVDREAPRYATRIFGRDFAVLSRAERLPGLLMALLHELVKR
jgi:nitric oxide reductase NorD protein